MKHMAGGVGIGRGGKTYGKWSIFASRGLGDRDPREGRIHVHRRRDAICFRSSHLETMASFHTP